MPKKSNISYGEGERQILDLYVPESKTNILLVYFHGGGLESGSKDESGWLANFAERGIAVAVPNYRIYPNAKYPDFIEDAALSVAWCCENLREYERIFVGGSSAGAYLAMMLCLDEKYIKRYNICPNDFAGWIFNAGQPTVHYNVLREFGVDPRAVIIDERAPIFHIREGRKYAPMLVLCGANDMQGRYEQTALFCATMRHFGYNNFKFELMDAEYGHCGHDDKEVYWDIVERFVRNGEV